MHFTWLTPPGSYRATTCRERELTLDHIHTSLTTQGHGGPPRMSDQLNAGSTTKTTRTLKTIHIMHWLIHSNKGIMITMIMIAKWYSGNHGDLKLPDICFTIEKNLEKTSPRKLVPTRDRTGARCVTGAHATSCSTAVDLCSSSH